MSETTLAIRIIDQAISNPATLRAYINGSALGRPEPPDSHTQFDRLRGLAYLRGGRIVLLRGEEGITKNDWPKLDVITAPTKLLETPPESLSNSLLTVLPTIEEGLNVTLAGIPFKAAEPIVVSLCGSDNGQDVLLIVLEFPDGVVIDSNFGSQDFRERFPIYKDDFRKDGGRSYPRMKATREDGKGMRILMQTESTNLEEIRLDRNDIKQMLVVGTNDKVDLPYLELTDSNPAHTIR